MTGVEIPLGIRQRRIMWTLTHLTYQHRDVVYKVLVENVRGYSMVASDDEVSSTTGTAHATKALSTRTV